MLKNVVNYIIKNRFINLYGEDKFFLRFSYKKPLTSGRTYFSPVKLCSVFEKIYSRPVFQNDSLYKKPVILLSGILTFLGLQPPEEPELIMKIKRGILFMQRKQYDKANVMLHKALELAQDERDEDAITYIYDMLADLAFETGEHSKAETLYVNILQRLLAKGEPQDSNKVVHISLKLAKIFQDTKQFKKAEQGFTFCIETLDKKLEEEDENTLALWGMTMDWYARFLLHIDRKSEALECFKKAYNMCIKVNGVENEQTVVLLNDLGTISSLMGDTETAMSYFEEARDIGNKLPEMKDLAAIYINLGQLYLLREMYKESKIACEEGLKKANYFKDEVSTSEAKQCLENIKKVFESEHEGKEFKLISSEKSKHKKAQLVG